jgi:hypothetical protein
MKLLNSSSSHGWERERERYIERERERLFIDGMGGRERERLFIDRHRNGK